MKPERPRLVFVLIAAGFAVGAAYHVAALARPALDPSSPPWRHGLFVAVNVLVGAGLVWRPRGFAPLFALLTTQQLASHGARAWGMWRGEGRVDWASLVVMLAMPAILVMLVRDGRGSKVAGRR